MFPPSHQPLPTPSASLPASTAAASSIPPTTTTSPPPTSTPTHHPPTTHLSPTHNSSTTSKPNTTLNVQTVVLGDILFKTWYPSFYPEELVGRTTDRLYVCRWCFRYSRELLPFLGHARVCAMRTEGPPGRVIWEREGYSVWEVDGEGDKLFTQNLSLFAKLFLDNKSVFFDVTSFHYYLLVHTAPGTKNERQIVGFFSKEKMSWDNNNLACILVFPPWLRKGLGKILMGVSYELSRREGRIGGPEKPLSELGRRGYLRFWSARVARSILAAPVKKVVTVKWISEDAFMLPDDVIAALKEMNVLNSKKKADGTAVVTKAKVREWAKVNGVDVHLTPFVNADGFVDGWVLGTGYG